MTKLITTLLCFVMVLCNAAYGFSQNFDTRTKSDISAEQLDAKLKNKLSGCGQYFIAAQNKYGVNAEFLAAIAIHESGNGASRAARTKNNFFGLMGKRGQLKFNSPKECIDYAANNIARPGGFYHGRKRYTVISIGKRYATSKLWTQRIISTMKFIKKS